MDKINTMYNGMKCDIFTIWKTHKNDLKGYVRKRVALEDDVNDILQSVLIKITNYCETKSNVTYIKPWIYKITQNTIIDFYKKAKRTKRTSNTEFERLHLEANQGIDEEIYIWLYNFIDYLPTKYSVPLKLSDIEGKAQKEVAKELGLTLSATKSRIQRARVKLKEKFDECGIVEQSENQGIHYTVTKSCCLK